MREIILSKIESIEKCIERIQEKANSADYNLDDYDTQDIIVLNLQRAAQQSIDLSMYLSAELKLGIPKDSVDAFKKLLEKSIIDDDTFKAMKGMVGFRNVAIHQYQKINYDIVDYVVKNRLIDFRKFIKALIQSLL